VPYVVSVCNMGHYIIVQIIYPIENEFSNAPIRIMALVVENDFNIAIIDRGSVVGPIMVAFLSAFFFDPRQHDNCPTVAFPHHSPKVVPRRVKRTLRYDKFPW